MSKYGVFPLLQFLVFRLKIRRFTDIQSEYGKIRTRKNSVFEHFSRSFRITSRGGWLIHPTVPPLRFPINFRVKMMVWFKSIVSKNTHASLTFWNTRAKLTFYNHGQNIWEKVQFSYETPHYGKILISVFQQLFASINKIFILGGGLCTRL